MIKSIRNIKFSIGGYSQGESFYTLENDLLSYWHNGFAGMEEPFDDVNRKKLTDSDQAKLMALFNKLDFLSWEREYQMLACDGTQWEIMVTYNGNLKKKVFGSNAYPEGFDKIERLFKRLLRTTI